MIQDARVSDITEYLHEYLALQSASVGEYQVIQHLSQKGVFDAFSDLSTSLALFKKHFLTMHALYSLQKNLLGTTQGLTVTPLTIELLDLDNIQADSQSVGMESARISEYYLDLTNLAEATEETVEDLLSSFWMRFSQWQSGGDAFGALGLTASATWDEVQRAYRRKVQVEHPDKGGCAERFAEYSDAYQQLKSHFSL